MNLLAQLAPRFCCLCLCVSAGWLFAASGCDSLALEACVIVGAAASGAMLVGVVGWPWALLCSIGVGAALGSLLLFTCEGRRAGAVRMAVFNVAATVLLVQRPGVCSTSTTFVVAGLAAIAVPLAVAYVLLRTDVGTGLRAAGTAPDLMTRLGGRPSLFRGLAVAVAGAMAAAGGGCASACGAGVVGYGYIAYLILLVRPFNSLLVGITGCLAAAVAETAVLGQAPSGISGLVLVLLVHGFLRLTGRAGETPLSPLNPAAQP